MTSANHLLSLPNNTHRHWWRDKSLRQNVLHCAGCCLCVFYLGYDQALLAALQAIPEWNAYFDTPTGTKLGLIASSLYFPGLIASFFGSWVSMRYGRKPTVGIGSALIIIGTIVNALAKNTGVFCGGRVLIGAGGAITKLFAPVLVIAITSTGPESPRFLINKGRNEQALGVLAKYHANGKVDDPLVQAEYGEICAALEAEGEEHKSAWTDLVLTKGNRRRIVMAILMACGTNWTGSGLLGYYLTPILASVGIKDPKQTTSLNGEPYLAPGFLLHLTRRRRPSLSVRVGGLTRATLPSLTKGNRRRIVMAILMACGTNWTGSGLLGYYLTPILASVGIKDPKQTTSLNGGLALWNLLSCELAATQVNRISRRVSFFISGIGMISAIAIVTGMSATFAAGKQSFGIPTVPFIFIFFFFYDIAWMALPFHYCTEIMPFHLRTKGLAIFTAVQTFANGFNQFVNPIAFKAIAWKYYILYIAINAAFLVYFYFFLIDSRGMSLEEITLLFDYPRKQARQRAAEDMHARVQARIEEKTRVESEKDSEKGDIVMVEDVAELGRDSGKSVV
ncbi:sugar transporter [Trichosporon asahii var. asahii CBS 2479]|uniref:Sugar transporter n=1 Tax=Trichosporon asahii var. asahii (strain ATCC 90039 / CBS 2479 / JCM 2466 / KCTC 7840 / NBRC 103889/ NCYC 2677 / UAMH 7654) TaxID=1186058 RepID=J5Q7W9_TRIAS|nr:sugar transporter [Trichosporon asahii var. asahii CBS 2479]EJT45948.1 sugar transporter [Trichosporon asahii var. asahii CBS 2479]